jgi:hypothetical protein
MDWNVSRIREHNLRSVWENEERDFTRWLTENIDLLASELGIEIEDARAEEAVGDFSADIVARGTLSASRRSKPRETPGSAAPRNAAGRGTPRRSIRSSPSTAPKRKARGRSVGF